MNKQDDLFHIHPGQKSLQVCYCGMHEFEGTLSTIALRIPGKASLFQLSLNAPA